MQPNIMQSDELVLPPGRVHIRDSVPRGAIDGQLLPRAAYDDLLSRHDFSGIAWFGLTPVHAVTDGRQTNN